MNPVSESATAPPEEPVGAVAALFGDRAATARRFRDHLAGTAVQRGLIGPREVPRLWERHILNCASIGELVPVSATLADVGSGAGLPGLAVAIARPDVRVTLVEPLQRRVTWLLEVVDDLALPNVTVVRARAEELRGDLTVEVATARAVAALPVLAGWCLPLVVPGGRLLAVKGQSAVEELAASEDALRGLGATGWSVHRCGVGVLEQPTVVVEVVAGRRPTGGATRRPGAGSGSRRRQGHRSARG
jgi:16S rRNA (guanine527-N7)-methyltransferase